MILGASDRIFLAGVAIGAVGLVLVARADGPVNPGATAADIAALWAAMPQPADIVPPTDTLNGAVGTSLRYMRQDAPRPTISQRATVTTDGSGNWSVNWNKNFSTVIGAPIVVPTPLDAGGTKPNCKTRTTSAGSASGYCWVENVQPALVTVLGINVLSGVTVSSNWTGGSVMVVGLEPSQ
jgi:hypothetical protein